MISVLFGRNLILGLSLKVDEKKTSFFFEEAEGRREKKLVFLRRSKVESSKVRFGPKRTDIILLLYTSSNAALIQYGWVDVHWCHYCCKTT